MFAIRDNVTGEWLESYHNERDVWTGGSRWPNLQTFESKDAAQKVIDALTQSFRKGGETDIEFVIRPVEQLQYWQEKK